MAFWPEGRCVVRREIWRGRVLTAMPVRVVRTRPSWSAGWQGHDLLMLHRPEDGYALWVFWTGAERRFDRWYVNFQAPIRRHDLGFDTLDHELDLWSSDGRAWHWKDDALLDRRVAEGWFSAEAAQIRAGARRVRHELEAGRAWWDPAWASWTPPPSAGPLRLPDGWDALPMPRA